MAIIETNIQKTIDKIKKLSGNISDMSGFYNEIASLELSSTLLRFKDEEDPQGRKWRDPITLRRDQGGSSYSKEQAWGYWKASNFHAILPGWHFFGEDPKDKILKDTGILGKSIQEKSGKDFAEVGTSIKYGKYVQNLGFNFIGISKKTKDNVKKAYDFYMREIIK